MNATERLLSENAADYSLQNTLRLALAVGRENQRRSARVRESWRWQA